MRDIVQSERRLGRRYDWVLLGRPDVVLGRALTPDALYEAARASNAVHSRNGTVFSRPGRCLTETYCRSDTWVLATRRAADVYVHATMREFHRRTGCDEARAALMGYGRGPQSSQNGGADVEDPSGGSSASLRARRSEMAAAALWTTAAVEYVEITDEFGRVRKVVKGSEEAATRASSVKSLTTRRLCASATEGGAKVPSSKRRTPPLPRGARASLRPRTRSARPR